MIDDLSKLGSGEIVPFGRRPIPPRACIVENKTHVRMFLAEMLDEHLCVKPALSTSGPCFGIFVPT